MLLHCTHCASIRGMPEMRKCQQSCMQTQSAMQSTKGYAKHLTMMLMSHVVWLRDFYALAQPIWVSCQYPGALKLLLCCCSVYGASLPEGPAREVGTVRTQVQLDRRHLQVSHCPPCGSPASVIRLHETKVSACNGCSCMWIYAPRWAMKHD